MELGKPDASGRRRPVPIEGSEFNMDIDNLIMAIGQVVDKEMLPDNLEYTGWGTITVDPETLETSIEGVFAGGDVVAGPADVISAIATGRQAAISIDKYLGGDGDIDEELVPQEGEILPFDVAEAEGEKYRPPMRLMALDERLHCFAQVELGFDEQQAIEETKRCLRCDLEER